MGLTTDQIYHWIYYDLMDNEAWAVGVKIMGQYVYFDELRSKAELLVKNMTEPELEDLLGDEDCADIARKHLARATPGELINAISEVMGMEPANIEAEIIKSDGMRG